MVVVVLLVWLFCGHVIRVICLVGWFAASCLMFMFPFDFCCVVYVGFLFCCYYFLVWL